MRNDYHSLMASDFQCVVDLKGTVVARSYDPFNDTTVYTHVTDLASNVSGVLIARIFDRTRHLLIRSPTSYFSCSKSR